MAFAGSRGNSSESHIDNAIRYSVSIKTANRENSPTGVVLAWCSSCVMEVEVEAEGSWVKESNRVMCDVVKV